MCDTESKMKKYGTRHSSKMRCLITILEKRGLITIFERKGDLINFVTLKGGLIREITVRD